MSAYAQRPFSSILPITLVAPPATVITALLFLLMHSLIASDTPIIDDVSTPVAEIVVPDQEPLELTRIQPPAKSVEVTPPPEWQAPLSKLRLENTELGQFTGTPVPIGDEGIEIGVGGGGIVAYLKLQPVYPSRPLSRGIEGYVDLAFDITSTGSTTNIRVIDAQPQSLFERAAIKALEKWKYKVPVIDGVAQGQVDMMTRMTFKVEA